MSQTAEAVVQPSASRRRGANVNSKISGRTPLHCASYRGYISIVNKLLRHGADINALDTDKRTPLDRALLNNDKKMVYLLVKNGADPLKILKGNEGKCVEEIKKGLISRHFMDELKDGCIFYINKHINKYKRNEISILPKDVRKDIIYHL